MSYIHVKNPAFPKLGRLRLGNYAPVTNPAFPMMSDFGTPSSCPGKCASCPKKRKCRSKRRAGLGQDDNFGVPIDLVNFSQPTAQYPASSASGISYTGAGSVPVSYDDTSPTGPSSPVPSVASSGVVPVLNNPQTSYLSLPSFAYPTGAVPTTLANATSPLGGLSTTELILGGLGVLALVMVAGAGKRR